MRTVTYRLADLQRAVIQIGYCGENEHTRVIFDCKRVFDEYPSAVSALTVQPPSGAAYPAVIVRDGDSVYWDVYDSDLAEEGRGEAQLTFSQGGVVVKSFIFRTIIERSIMGEGEIPEPLDDFLARAGEALTAIPQTIQDTFDEISAEAETLQPGSAATAAFDSETMKVSFGIPAGEKGDPGQPGSDGVSPTVAISSITGGHRIAITDKNGTHTADVMNGTPGTPGTDGISPTVTTSKSGKTTTITITDKNGDHTATLIDGTDGQDGQDATPDLIAAAYEDLTYPVSAGTLCYNGEVLYRAKQDIPTSESWTAGHWDATTVADELSRQYGAINGKQDAPETAGTAGQMLSLDSNLDPVWGDINPVETVSGTTPSITAKAGVRYICGEVATLTIAVPASGIIDVTFDSGSTPTVLTVTPPTGMTMRWIGEDPTALEANKHYEINIADGCNGMVVSWT